MKHKFPAPTFSHSGEDRLISKIAPTIQRNKLYVDVGAYHPTQYSNTYLLYLAGWRGLCVDADDHFREEFTRVRPRDTIVSCGVSNRLDTLDFFVFSDRSLNTFCPKAAAENARRYGSAAREVKRVPVCPLSAILAEYHVTAFDYLNIDVEGKDVEVLESLDFARWHPSLITVEDHALNLANVQNSATFNLLSKAGYALHSKVNYTSFYIHAE